MIRMRPGGATSTGLCGILILGIKDIREDSVPEGAVEGTNDFKKRNYGGPCPPTRAHRYMFKLYVLDIRLNLEPRSTKPDLEKAMKGHILAQTQLITSYKKVGK